MRIALLVAQPLDAAAGNVSTLRRLERNLGALGVAVSAHSLSAQSEESLAQEVKREQVELLHAFHALRVGPAARRIAERLSIPYAVSLTGTDFNLDALDPGGRRELELVTERAGALMAVCGVGAGAALSGFRGAARLFAIPKGVELPDRALVEALFEADERARDDEDISFFLPAGWRPVKNNRFALEALEPVWRDDPRVRLLLAGPVLDLEFRKQAEELIRDRRLSFAQDHGSLSPERMANVFQHAQVVLNVSHAEAAPNAIVEAMAWGRPVLAADIPGNAALVRFDRSDWACGTGLLYRTEPIGQGFVRRHDLRDFAEMAQRLIRDRALRFTLGRNARAAAERDHSPQAEAEAVLAAYRHALSR